MRDLKGAHYLTVQQQYGLMLATYKDSGGKFGECDGGSGGGGSGSGCSGAFATFHDQPNSNVYILSLEMDGAGACSGLLASDDRIISVRALLLRNSTPWLAHINRPD